jgi:hypothetical protein
MNIQKNFQSVAENQGGGEERRTKGVERKELSISSREPPGWRGMDVGKGGYK